MCEDKEDRELQFDLLAKGQIDYIKYVEGVKTVVYFKSEIYCNTYYPTVVVDVDTSKVWRIDEYAGSEGIEYYREAEIINKDLNMGVW